MERPVSKVVRFLERYQVADFVMVFIGKGLGGAANLLFIVAAAKLLGSEQFGLFTLSITVMYISMQFAGQGLDIALVRFFICRLKEKDNREILVLNSCFYMRVLLVVIVLVGGVLLSEAYISYSRRPELRLPVLLGLAGCGAASLWYFYLSVLQAREKFLRYSLLSGGVNFLKLALLAALVGLKAYSVESLLVANVIAFMLGVAVVSWLSDFKPQALSRGMKEEAAQVMRFGKWIVFSGLTAVLYSKIDVLFLTAFADMEEVGYYSGAITLINCFDLVIISLFTVLLPNASKASSYADTKKYFKFATKISAVACLSLCLAYLFADHLVLLVLGDTYTRSITSFKIIFPGFLLYLFTFPWALLIYSYNKAHLLFMSDMTVLIFNVAACYVLIRHQGLIGAAWANLLTRIVNSVIIICLVVTQSKKLRTSEDAARSGP